MTGEIHEFDGAGRGRTEVTLVCENLPPGLRAEENEPGSLLGLEQLARRFE